MNVKCLKDTEGYWTEGEMYPARVVVDSLEFELKRQLTEAEQQEVSTVVEQLVLTFPEPCPRCGVTSTRPNGEHYCHANSVRAE